MKALKNIFVVILFLACLISFAQSEEVNNNPDVQVDRIESLDQVDLTDEDFKVLKMKLAINATMPQWAKGGRFPKIRLNDFDKQIIDSQIVALIPENTNTPVYYGLALYPSTALAEMGLEKAFLRNTAPPSISTWPTTGDRRRGSVVVKENIIIYADKTSPYTDAMISRVVKRIDIMLNTLPERLVARSANANHFFKIVGDYHFTPPRESAMREFLNSDPSIPWRLEALKWLCYHLRGLERLEQWVKDLERFHEQFGRTPLLSPSFDDAKRAVKRIREIDSKLNNLKNESKAAELLFEKADIVRRTVCDRPATLTLYMEILKDFPETGYENKVFEEIPQLMTEDSRLDQMLLHKLLDDPSWGTAHQYNKLTVYLLAKTYVSKEYPNEALLLIKACLNRSQGAETIEKELSSKAIKGIPSYFDNDTFVDPFVRLARLYKRVDPAAWEQFSKKLNQQHGYNKRVHLRLESINRQAEKPAPQVEVDFHVTRQKFLRLLALPEPQLRHAREAIQLFKERQDWPSLAIAYEVTAETMWRVTHMAPEAFIRPVTEQATDVMELRGRGGPYVMVQTNLDGEWVKGKGERQNWIGWIQRKQKDLALERIAVLKKLGTLCMDRLNDSSSAVLAYKATGRGVPVCTEPLETLIAQMWPVLKVEADEVLALDRPGASHIRLEPLRCLAEAQISSGNLRGAADTRLRAMLTALIGCRGDWNAHGSAKEAEAFWQVVRRLPLDQPLPPTLWLHVLDPQHPGITVTAPEDDPHGLPYSFPGPRLVIRPGHTAQTLTVAADMETPNASGGNGGVRCFTIIKGKVHEIGWVQWHKDGRRGRRWRQGTFGLPEDVGIIRLEITPFNGTDFHVRNLKVEAAFAASGVLPSGTAVQVED